jgi:hypothetical protein
MMMKLKATAAALVLLGCTLGYAQLASAQACGAAQGTLSASPFTGNNCNNQLAMGAMCSNGDTLGGGGMDVIDLNLGANTAMTFTLTSTASAFTPNLAVLGSPCSSNTACLIDNAAASAAGSATGNLPANTGPGSFFIFVANTADAACGAYSLAFTGTLPVKLQDFSVN